MKFNRKAIIGSGAAGIALAAAIYGGTAFAQTATPSGSAAASRSANYQTFVQHLASRLNLTQSQVDTAVKGAESDAVADAVKAGKLTQAQADAINQRIQSGGGFGMGFGMHGRPGPGRPGGPAGLVQRDTVTSAAAAALNMQASDLTTQLRSGKSLKDIATAQNVDFSKVQAAITAAVKPQLDQAVSSGKLTAQQETDILTRLTSGNVGRRPGPFGHRRPSGTPNPTPSASASATS